MSREGTITTQQQGVMKKDKQQYVVVDGSILRFFNKKGGDSERTIDLKTAKILKTEKKKKTVIEVVSLGKSLYLKPEEADVNDWFRDLKAAAGSGKKLTVEDFDLLNVVGKGSFGKVMQVRKKDTKTIYAMKVLSKKHIVANGEVEHTRSERNILEKLNHPFLMNLVYSFQTDDKLYFILDFVNGGELFFHLQKERRFPEPRVRFYAAEILLALEYLHENGVIYRDLKPENILLKEDGHICLTDFGLCKEGMEDDDRTGTFCGTPEYLAPEVLKGQGYTKSVDCWSFGSLVFEMLFGLPPFYSQDVQEMYRKIMTDPLRFPETASEEAKTLLTDLLKRDLKLRLVDPAKIKEYSFFKPIDWGAMERLEVEVPFKPTVSGKMDVGNVEDVFLQEAPDDNLDEQEEDEDAQPQEGDFDGFTFENPSVMAGASE